MNKLLGGLAILILWSCSGNSKLSHEETIRWQQYRVNGRNLFQANCANCHGINGEGIARLMPPVKNADWVVQNQKLIPCLIKNGSKGKRVVNGITFEGEMIAHEKLTNIEIAEITAFVLSDLNNVKDFYDSKQIIKFLENCDQN